MSVSVCSEDVEVTERIFCLGIDIPVSAGFEPEVNRRTGSGLGSHGFIGSWGVALSVPVHDDGSPSL